MDQLSKVQKILTESTLIICDNLDPETLLLTMQTKGALTPNDVKLIKTKVLKFDQAVLLLDILMKKPATSYDIFMEALLERANRKDLYDQIKAIEMNLKHGYVTAGTNDHNCQIQDPVNGNDNDNQLPQGPDALPKNIPFKLLKRELKKCITKEDVEEIKDFMKDDRPTTIEKNALERIKTCDELFNRLAEMRLFDANNLIYLPVLLNLHFSENHQSLKHIAKYCEDSKNDPLYTSRITRNGCDGFTFLEMKIKGDHKHFTKHSLEHYRDNLAEMLCIDKTNVRFEALNEGCILIVFLIPSTSAADLQKAALNNDKRLITMGVFGVHIQGEDYIPLVNINEGLPVACESDFCDITNELRHDELQHLFLNLGISHRDIKHAKRSADTNDTRLQARAVLRWWKQRHGNSATLDALFEAKREIRRTKDQPFNVTTWQKQLKAKYKARRGGIAFIPGFPKKFSSDEFFVALELLERIELPMEVKHVELKTYTDLLKLKSTQGKSLDHVLVSGLAGTGKTTLISRLAYKWATLHQGNSQLHKDGDDSPLESNLGSSSESYDYLGRFELVFALDIKKFGLNQDLIDAVRKQLLPLESREQLKFYLSCSINCLFLFDGFDEIGSNDQILSDDIICDSHTIVTTRLNKTNEFNIENEGYVQVQLNGFSNQSIELFVKAFVRGSGKNSEEESKQVKILLKDIRKKKATSDLSHFPLLLVMMCIIWKQEQSLPDTISALFQKVIKYLVKHWKTRESKHQANVQELLDKLGKVALNGLVDRDSRLIFQEDEFDSTDTVEEGCALGLMTTDCTVSEFDMVTNVSFTHKTFQEYCAAKYLANLAERDPDLCKTYVSKLETYNTEYLFRFTCGMTQNEIVLAFVVNQSCERIEHLKKTGNTFGIGCAGYDGVNPWRFPLILLYEAELQGGFNKSLHEVLKPLVSSIYLVNNLKVQDSELDRALQYYFQRIDTRTPYAWMCFVEQAFIFTKLLSEELSLPVQMLKGLPNLQSLTVKGDGFYHDCTHFLSAIQKERLGNSIKVLEFDDWCDCDIATINAFLYTQPNLNSLGIPPQPGFEPTNVTILIQVLQEVRERSGSITKITLQGENVDDGLMQHMCMYCHSLEKLCVSSSTSITPAGFQTLFKAAISASRTLMVKYSLQEGQSKRTANSLPLKYLDLHGCKLGDSAYTLADATIYLTSLECIDLCGCKLDEKHFHKLGPSFAHLPNLVTLDLSSNSIGASFCAITKGTNNCKLTQLRLDETNLTRESNNALHCMKLPLLKTLSFSNSSVTSDGAQTLSESLRYTPKLTALDLSNNNIGSNGTQALSASLQYIPQLTWLDLSNNSIESDGAQALSASLQYIPQLTDINLSHNNIGSYGTQALSASLQYIPQLTSLDLSNNNIESDGAQALSASFQYIPQLKEIDLSHNNIESGGAQALSASLQYTPQLKWLNLSHNNIKSNGVQALSASLQYIQKLNWLYLSHNNTGSDGAQALTASLRYIPQLTWLDLSHNNIGPDSAQPLAASFDYLSKLEYIGLSNNPIGPSGVEAMLKHSTHLHFPFFHIPRAIGYETQ